MKIPTDYRISKSDANEIKGAVLLQSDLRRKVIEKYRREHGTAALVNLFAEFIGMANSVVANAREVLEMVLICEFQDHPHSAEKINLPTIFGALQGVGVAIEPRPGMCGGCAFRVGTPANQSPITSSDAEWARDGACNFSCHESLDESGEPTKLCVGFANAKASVRDQRQASLLQEAAG